MSKSLSLVHINMQTAQRTTMMSSVGEEKEEDREQKIRPAWLKPLLETSFFLQCKIHGDSSKTSECNMYCIDCMRGALCSYCVAHHRHHHVIQIRRSSYHDVIRVSEIQKVLDITGVQTYIINSARVVFLNERPQPRPGKGVINTCQTCDRTLLDTYKFCSLGCKLTGTKLNREIKASQQRKQQQQQQQRNAIDSKKTSSFLQHDNAVKLHYNMSPPTPPPTTVIHHAATTKRRKGIPRRAPLGS